MILLASTRQILVDGVGQVIARSASGEIEPAVDAADVR
jgi:hypothetical protein